MTTDDNVGRVKAPEASNHLTLNSGIHQLVQQPGDPDPKAVAVAKAVLEKEAPDFAILFGSRARGDWGKESDIDLMLVTTEEPDGETRQAASEAASITAAREYGHETPVQIVWRTLEQYRHNRRYRNSLETEALRDAVVMPRDSEEYNASHYEDEETEYQHDWSAYNERLRHAEIHLAGFAKIEQPGYTDLEMGQKAQTLMEQSMKALIRAAGGNYRKEHDIGNLLGGMRHFDPEGMGEFELQIPPNVYSEYRGGDSEYYERESPELTSYPNYAERTMEDAVRIIERAKKLRRQSTL